MTGMKLATAYYELVPSMGGAQGQITQHFNGVGQSASKSFGNSFSRGLKSAIGPALALVGTATVANFFKGSLDQASDLNETLNLNEVIFKKDAKAMVAWSQTSDKAFGLTQQSALQATGQFGDMFNQLGFGRKASVKMSREVVQLAADLGSFKNLETSDVLERISAGFRGEYDSLQLLIPNITAARVEKEAMAATGKRTAESLNAEEKAAATLAIIQKDGAAAAGDFAKTSDGLANSQKILGAEFGNARAKLGEGLLPVATEFVHFLSDEGVPAVEKFGGWFTETGVPALRDFGDTIGPIATSSLPALNTTLGVSRDVLKEVAPLIKGIIDSFNSLPSGVQTAIVAGGAAAALGSKVNKGIGGKTAAAVGATAGAAAKGGGAVLGLAAILGLSGATTTADRVDDFKRLTKDAEDASGRLATTLNKNGKRTRSSVAAIKAEFESGRVGKYAADLGVDLDKLTDSFSKNGLQGDYVREVMGKLDSKYSKSANIFSDAFGHVPFVTEESSKIAGFTSSIRKLAEQYDLAGEKAYKNGNQTRDLGRLMLGGKRSADQLGFSLDGVGKKKPSPEVTTPGLTPARKGVFSLIEDLAILDKSHASPSISLVGAGLAGQQIGGLIGKLNEAGRKKSSLTIPGFASGTSSAPGGLSLVGERGPELVNLPRGAQVLPADVTRRALSGGSPALGGSDDSSFASVAALAQAISAHFLEGAEMIANSAVDSNNAHLGQLGRMGY